MKTYPTADLAYRRQSYLAREYGVFSGVRRIGDRWALLYNPDTYSDHSPPARLKDVEAEYLEDEDRFDWLPDAA